MAKRPIEPEEEFQFLRENWIRPDVDQVPEYISRYFLRNIIYPVFAYVMGKGINHAVPVEATEDGRLKVVSQPGGFSNYSRYYDTSVLDAYTQVTPTEIAGRADVWVWDNDVSIATRPTASSGWQSDIIVPANSFYSFDCDIQALRYKNTTAGATGKIQLVLWY